MKDKLDPASVIKNPRLDIANRVQEMDTDLLFDELKRVLSVTAETIAYLGEIWRELERRGQDLSSYKSGMGYFIPHIAAGRLAPEAVIQFAGRLNLLRVVQNLSIELQTKIAGGSVIPVVFIVNDGSMMVREMVAHELTNDQIKIVFNGSTIRTVEQQENLILSHETIKFHKNESQPDRRYLVKVRKNDGLIQVGKMTVRIEDMLYSLRQAGIIE